MLKTIHKGTIKWVIITTVFSSMQFFQEGIMAQTVWETKASASSTLGCRNTSVELNCYSNKQGVTYKWKGPNGFISTGNKPRTSLPGEYTVYLTDPESGIVKSSSVIVHSDFDKPQDVTLTASGDLNCLDTMISIKGSSSTNGVIYEWKGEGFSSLLKETKVSKPGIYKLIVTNPENGCFVEKHIQINANKQLPKSVSASSSGELNCITKSVQLTGNSESTEVVFSWKGPDGFTSSEPATSVTKPGIYRLMVTNPDNGCSVEVDLKVEQNIQKPSDFEISVSDTLSCVTKKVLLSFNSDEHGLVYSWKGPDGFESNEKEVHVKTAGKYTLELKNPVNGCSFTQKAFVVQDIAKPDDLKLIAGMLTCKDSISSVETISRYPNLSYSWSGPNNFGSKEQAPSFSRAGEYIAVITNNNNGCKAQKTILIKENKEKPQGVKAKVFGEIDCDTKNVQLKGECMNRNVEYHWIGPEGFFSSQAQTMVSRGGDYMLTVKNIENGCLSKAQVTVIDQCKE